MRVFYHPLSPNSRRVLVAIEELALPVEREIVELGQGAHRQAEFLAVNPNGLVPALVDGDFRLWESNAILHYLASRVPTPLWPEDDRVRADVTRWQFWQTAHMSPAIDAVFQERVLKQRMGQGEPDAAHVEDGLKRFARYAPVLDTHLRDRAFLVGDELTLADIAVGTAFTYARAADLPLAGLPDLSAWLGRLEARPSFVATRPKIG